MSGVEKQIPELLFLDSECTIYVSYNAICFNAVNYNRRANGGQRAICLLFLQLNLL